MSTEQAPAQYSCYNNLQIVANINVQNIFDLNSPQQTSIADTINSESQSPVHILYTFINQIMFLLISLYRVIHFHLSNIPIVQLLSIYE